MTRLERVSIKLTNKKLRYTRKGSTQIKTLRMVLELDKKTKNNKFECEI